jgi:Protein of unknown function (DUF1579)
MGLAVFTAVALALLGLVATPASAQEPPKPGPEHELLKQMAGTWDCTMKATMGPDGKGVMVYKVGLGGLWLVSNFQGEFGGLKFKGHGMDSYDAAKKKYVSVWFDSFGTSPSLSEGTFDRATKKMTMIGEGPGPDGKPVKSTSVTEYQDADNMILTMSSPGPNGKDVVMMTITCKKRK